MLTAKETSVEGTDQCEITHSNHVALVSSMYRCPRPKVLLAKLTAERS